MEPGGISVLSSDLEKTDPQKADEVRRTSEGFAHHPAWRGLDEQVERELGGLKVEVIHLGGHTQICLWSGFPKQGAFRFRLDLQGRYPYIFNADIPDWITVKPVMNIGASVIIPGHGVMCGAARMVYCLREYLQSTWELTATHLRLGHSPDETAADPTFPRFSDQKYERLHQANIGCMYQKIIS